MLRLAASLLLGSIESLDVNEECACYSFAVRLAVVVPGCDRDSDCASNPLQVLNNNCVHALLARLSLRLWMHAVGGRDFNREH